MSWWWRGWNDDRGRWWHDRSRGWPQPNDRWGLVEPWRRWDSPEPGRSAAWSGGWSGWPTVIDIEGESQDSRSNQTAVAATGAQDWQSSVTITVGIDFQPQSRAPEIIGLEYFRQYKKWNYSYRQHAAALKYLRDTSEPKGIDYVPLSSTKAHFVPQMILVGNIYHFRRDVLMIPWVWMEMVAQLDETGIQTVLGGSRGFVSCGVEKTDTVDHQRQKSRAPGAPDELKVWDFKLVREDGAHVFLHPGCYRKMVECEIRETDGFEVKCELFFDESKHPIDRGRTPQSRNVPSVEKAYHPPRPQNARPPPQLEASPPLKAPPPPTARPLRNFPIPSPPPLNEVGKSPPLKAHPPHKAHPPQNANPPPLKAGFPYKAPPAPRAG